MIAEFTLNDGNPVSINLLNDCSFRPLYLFRHGLGGGGMEQRELIKRMRGRIDHCRRLALQTIDPHTADALIQMANEGEEDVQRLLAGTSAKLPQIGGSGAQPL